MSPAKRAFRRKSAAVVSAAHAVAAAAGIAVPEGSEATEYELLRAALGVDIRRLRDIQSVESKIALKPELIEKYEPWIAGVLQADSGAHDDILVQVMIWLIDIGAFARAMPLADYVLRHALKLPERFNRTAATLIVEEIADAALKALGAHQDADIEALQRIEWIAAEHDMPDQVKAKLFKAIGLQIVRIVEGRPDEQLPAGGRRAGVERALDYLRRAYGLSHTAGVKKDIDRLERELRKLTTAEAADQQGEAQ